MNGHSLNTRDRRVVFFGVGAIVVILALGRGLPAWRAWRSRVQDTAFEAISRAKETEAALNTLARTLDSLESRSGRLVRLGPALVTGDTPNEAAANLSALIADQARQSAVRLDAAEVRADTSDTSLLPHIGIDLQATADVTGLAAFLRRLEQGPVLIAVRRTEIRPMSVAGDSTSIEMLTLRLRGEALALLRTSGAAQ